MEHTYGPSDLSVLMSTHAGERAEYLRRSLQSVFGQTMPAAECVLVLDGPVGEDQHDVIRSFA
ncbi:MAG TPA: hypothetical protein VLL76_04040, partial [Candidatus Omnitrophota bacterium]|nr:hypothetical protein [Candidatus Omnitrophota bacterium]